MKAIMGKWNKIEGTWEWRHLNVVLFNSSFLALLHLHRYSAAKILRAIVCQFGIHSSSEPTLYEKKPNYDNSCSVFLSLQWRAQRLIIDDESSSRRNSKPSRMPLKLEKRRFIILLVVGDISPEVVLNSFIDFKLKYFTRQVFSLLWQCPYNTDTPTVKEDCDI